MNHKVNDILNYTSAYEQIEYRKEKSQNNFDNFQINILINSIR